MLPRLYGTHTAFAPLTNDLEGLFRAFNELSPTESEKTATAYAAPLDIYEHEDRFEVSLDLPGIRREDVKLALENQTLVISGERAAQAVTESQSKNYRRTERWTGAFSRTLQLPTTVDTARIDAKLADGVLKLTLPKSDRAKARQITIS